VASRAESVAAAIAALRAAATQQPSQLQPPGLALQVLHYGELSDTALSLGIPRRALPQPPQPLTAAGVKRCADELELIIQSFMSSGL